MSGSPCQPGLDALVPAYWDARLHGGAPRIAHCGQLRRQRSILAFDQLCQLGKAQAERVDERQDGRPGRPGLPALDPPECPCARASLHGELLLADALVFARTA